MKVIATKSTKVKKDLKKIVFISMILSLVLFYIVLTTKLNILIVLATIISFYLFITRTIALSKQIKRPENLITKKGNVLNVNVTPKFNLEILISDVEDIKGKRYSRRKQLSGFGYVIIETQNVNYKIGIIDDYQVVVKRLGALTNK